MSNLLQRLRCGECGEPEPDVTRCLRCVAADEIERGYCEGSIKTRALEVACRELNNCAGFVEDYAKTTLNKQVLEDIGRTLDQCRNARHGQLSTDPWPEIISEGLTKIDETEAEALRLDPT